MSIIVNSTTILDGVLTIDATITAPSGHKIRSFFIRCGGKNAYYLIPRDYYYSTSSAYNQVTQTITTGRSISRIPLAQWANGSLDFVASAKYVPLAGGTTVEEATPVTVNVTNTFYQAPQAPDLIVQPEGQLQQPVITAFDVPTSVSGFTVPVTLSAKDNNVVAAYLVKETAAAPAVNDSAWAANIGSVPVVGYGDHTLYAWAKDADGNVSDMVSTVVTILPPPPPFATPKGGKYQTGRAVVLTDPAGGIILYTTDGSDPRSVIVTDGGLAQFDDGKLMTEGDVQ